MSELRKQLQSLKDEYRLARYPGNLAEELLTSSQGTQWSRWRIGGYVTIATGIAAVFIRKRWVQAFAVAIQILGWLWYFGKLQTALSG